MMSLLAWINAANAALFWFGAIQHIEGIAAYCDHHVRFGVVESVNSTIKAVSRHPRGMRDDEMLLLKLKRATAHPIRSAQDL